MAIEYKDTKDFTAEELKRLFLSVKWSSGAYPERLVVALRNSDTVFSAWDGDRLIGLINVLDDSIMTAYIHYLLVDPEYQGQGIGKELTRMTLEKYKEYLRILLISYEDGVAFYESLGFKTRQIPHVRYYAHDINLFLKPTSGKYFILFSRKTFISGHIILPEFFIISSSRNKFLFTSIARRFVVKSAKNTRFFSR